MKYRACSLLLTFCMLAAVLTCAISTDMITSARSVETTAAETAAQKETAAPAGTTAAAERDEPFVPADSASDACIAMIKQFEGFTAYAVRDRSYYSIGYGSRCKLSDYPNGISEYEADLILREHVADMETALNAFLTEYGIKLAQNRYDALVCFTYNVGTNWMDPSYRIARMLINGLENYSDTDVLSAIAVWSHFSGDSVLPGLAERRIAEGRLLLYGVYADGCDIDGNEVDAPVLYYVILVSGDSADVDHDVLVYSENSTYGEIEAAVTTAAGSYFRGWYTETEGGIRIGINDMVTESITLYAQWDDEPASTESSGATTGAPETPAAD